MFRTVDIPGLCIVGGWLALAMLVPIESAHAKNKETVFYSLGSGTNGVLPLAPVIEDKQGNLYGTTAEGGANEGGTLVKITPDGTETTLHSFPAYSGDGMFPRGALLADPKGNLYGTTQEGGANSGGAVFKLSRNGTDSLLYSFCSQKIALTGRLPSPG